VILLKYCGNLTTHLRPPSQHFLSVVLSGKVPRILAALARQQEVLVSLSAALPLLDLLHLGEACSELRRAMQSAPELRRRLKEARSAATAVLARKRIKAEQKKQRNAHKPSNDRVDAYSRGCCGK